MGEFEVLDRDGLARLGRLETPHGPIETPALLPVVHPDPARQPIAPSEIRRRFGLRAVITSSYITYRTPALRATAEEGGIHRLLGFDGPVMTDSGAFQQHAYGQVEVTPEEIHAFQRRIGSDIATVLDIFVEPDAPEPEASRGVETTIERARAARELQRGLLAVPVQGGRYPELRFRSAEAASALGDVLAVGGVVPLLEQYRYADLARALIAARPALAPECAVHLFGTGHPMVFAFAALFGVDLFDSSSYHKFARRGALMFAHGTISIDALREATCRCALCAEVPLPEVARRPPAERERRIAEHNLLMCAQEVSEVRQAIRDGTLWELAERRASGHPALLAGLKAAVRGTRVFLAAEPESRTSYRYVGPTSGLRPGAIRFLALAERWRQGKGPFLDHPWVPLHPAALRTTPTHDAQGVELWWSVLTPFGAVPLELTDLYPIGSYVGPDEFDEGGLRRSGAAHATSVSVPEGTEVEPGRDWSVAWERRLARGLVEFSYGPAAAEAIAARGLTVERSRRTGRLRAYADDTGRLLVVGADGLARPTWRGGRLLHELLPAPARRIVVAPEAEEFVASGRSLFSKFVRGGDSSLHPGASALLVDADDHLLAVGRLLLAPYEMGRLQRGVAVRVVAHAHRPEEPLPAEEPAATDAPSRDEP